MADTARARKLADRIRVVVAEALEKRIKDPRLGFVTVTDARVTNDLQHATVFYTVFGDAEEQAASAAALESARGVLRSEVGRRTGIRLTPTLEFIADAVPENAAHIEDLLRVAAARDADVAALAATASYAGDPDPYRRDDDADEDGDEVLEDEDDEDFEDTGEGEDDEDFDAEGRQDEDDAAPAPGRVRAGSERP
ncbi:MAG TPA: 30S ribosome-binding factor RbfA [Kineosporiaceae bacterium]|nr:30S ribosome-binding factor RbfA [Kineosporiaceae bacterium]